MHNIRTRTRRPVSLCLSDHGLISMCLYLDLSTRFCVWISRLTCASPGLFPSPPSSLSSLLWPPLCPPHPIPASHSLPSPLVPTHFTLPSFPNFFSLLINESLYLNSPRNRPPSQKKYSVLDAYFIWDIVTEKLEQNMK